MIRIRRTVLGILTLAAGIAVCGGGATRAAETIAQVDARVIAINIPGASAIAQVGTFLGPTAPVPPSFPFSCTLPSPIPGFMNGDFIKTGAVLDPNRILVGSSSNFGATPAIGVGQEGSFLSINPSATSIISVPANFAASGLQGPPGGAVQMFSANSPNWLNGINN